MAWLRLYDDILDDPKIQLLSDRDFRLLINLWCLAKRHGGIIPDDMKTLTFALRLNEAKLRAGLQTLIGANLLERVKTGYAPHDWDEHQFSSDTDAAERMRRYRARNRDGRPLRNGDVTRYANGERNRDVLEAEPDSEPEAESPPIPPPKGGVLSPPQSVTNGYGPDFEAFWDAYPVKKARDLAEKSYLRALTRASPAELLASAKRYSSEI
jgi:hypothetical protein